MSKKHIFLLLLHLNEADDVIILVTWHILPIFLDFAIRNKWSLKISNEKSNSVENGSSFNFQPCLLILIIFPQWTTLNKMVAMATTLFTVHCKLFHMMPYIVILKVRKFHQPTASRFSTARKKPVPPPAWIGLRYSTCDFSYTWLVKIYAVDRWCFSGGFRLHFTRWIKNHQASQKIWKVEIGSKNISTICLMIGCKKAVLHPRGKGWN